MLAGFRANLSSVAHAYSAKAPRDTPNTSSPGLNSVTFLPTASTWPATSTPSRLSFGVRSPGMRRINGAPLIVNKSSGFTRRRANLYQDLIVLGGRFFHLRELQRIRRSVFCAYNRFHKVLFKRAQSGSIGQTLWLSPD